MPHFPQFCGSERVSTQSDPHRLRLPPHSHVPEWQICPDEQTSPQPPQFPLSVSGSTQARLQEIFPAAQLDEQAPSEQTWSAEQATLHPPQLVGSLERSTQALLQTIRPAVHPAAHLPAEQTWPAAQAAAHAPQFFASCERSTQDPLQEVLPVSQAGGVPGVHRSCKQYIPSGHWSLRSQNIGSVRVQASGSAASEAVTIRARIQGAYWWRGMSHLRERVERPFRGPPGQGRERQGAHCSPLPSGDRLGCP